MMWISVTDHSQFKSKSFTCSPPLQAFASDLQDDKKSTKGRMRERTRPKMGKIDIDYQKLHDAFFKYQTKPHMTSYGDLYYEVRVPCLFVPPIA